MTNLASFGIAPSYDVPNVGDIDFSAFDRNAALGRYRTYQDQPRLSFKEIFNLAKQTQGVKETIITPASLLKKHAGATDQVLPNHFSPKLYSMLLDGVNQTANKKAIVEAAIDHGVAYAMDLKNYFRKQERFQGKLANQPLWAVIAASIVADVTDPYMLAGGTALGILTGGAGAAIGAGIRVSRRGAAIMNKMYQKSNVVRNSFLSSATAAGLENVAIEKLRQVYNPTITTDDLIYAGLTGAAFGGAIGAGFSYGGKSIQNFRMRSQIEQLDRIRDELIIARQSSDIGNVALSEFGWAADRSIDLTLQEVMISKVRLLNKITGQDFDIRRTIFGVFSDIEKLNDPQGNEYLKAINKMVKKDPDILNKPFDLSEFEYKISFPFEKPFDGLVDFISENEIQIIATPADVIEGRTNLQAASDFVTMYQIANDAGSYALNQFVKGEVGERSTRQIHPLQQLSAIRVPSRAKINKMYRPEVYDAVKRIYGNDGLRVLLLDPKLLKYPILHIDNREKVSFKKTSADEMVQRVGAVLGLRGKLDSASDLRASPDSADFHAREMLGVDSTVSADKVNEMYAERFSNVQEYFDSLFRDKENISDIKDIANDYKEFSDMMRTVFRHTVTEDNYEVAKQDFLDMINKGDNQCAI